MNTTFINFIKKNFVLLIAIILATITCFFVPFDKEYIGYFNLNTLSCLFCTLAVISAFKNISFFSYLADLIVKKFKNIKTP